MRIFHISDLHIDADPAANNARGLPSRLAQLAYDMDRPDDVCVITGDIVDDGTAEQYQRALELLTPLRGQVLLCPGNHDVGALGLLYHPAAVERYEAFAALMGSHRRATIGAVALLGLDSTLDTLHPFDAARGEIGGAQLDWLARELSVAKKAGLKTVVYLHHYAHHVGGIEGILLRLIDGDELLREVWGVADLVLCGHDHGEFIWRCPRRAQTVYHMAADFGVFGRAPWIYDVISRQSKASSASENPYDGRPSYPDNSRYGPAQ